MSENEKFEIEPETCSDLRTVRRESEKDYMEISDEADIAPEVVTYHVTGECDHTHDVEPLDKDRPWTEKALLKYLLIDKNMDYTEVGEAFGCHQETVKNWAGEDRFDITVIDNSERVSSKTVRKMHRKGVQLEQDIEDPIERLHKLHESLDN